MPTLELPTGLVPPLAVLQSVKALLTPATIHCAGAQWDGQPAFEKVGLFNVEQFEKALISLLETSSDRVAIIVPVRLDNSTDRAGRNLKRRRSLEFIVIVADAVVADFDSAAAFSDAAIANPGAWALAEAVDMVLMGASLGQPHVALEAGDWEPLAVTNEAGEGRAALACTWRTELGHQAFDLGRPTGRAATSVFGAAAPTFQVQIP